MHTLSFIVHLLLRYVNVFVARIIRTILVQLGPDVIRISHEVPSRESRFRVRVLHVSYLFGLLSNWKQWQLARGIQLQSSMRRLTSFLSVVVKYVPTGRMSPSRAMQLLRRNIVANITKYVVTRSYDNYIYFRNRGHVWIRSKLETRNQEPHKDYFYQINKTNYL
jgi:hypothetical protein